MIDTFERKHLKVQFNDEDIIEKNLHSWSHYGHPGINRPAWYLLTRSVLWSNAFTSQSPHCCICGTNGSFSFAHTQIHVVRVPLGASTVIFESKFPLKRAISLKEIHRWICVFITCLFILSPQLLPVLALLLPGTRPRWCALKASKEMLREQFCQMNSRGPLITCTCTCFSVDFLSEFETVDSISHSGLAMSVSCLLQHQREGLTELVIRFLGGIQRLNLPRP